MAGTTAFLLLFLLSTHAVEIFTGTSHSRWATPPGTGSRTEAVPSSSTRGSTSTRPAEDGEPGGDAIEARRAPLCRSHRDLRRTNQNDVFVYYLFPRLKPASFYVELDPPVSRTDRRFPMSYGTQTLITAAPLGSLDRAECVPSLRVVGREPGRAGQLMPD